MQGFRIILGKLHLLEKTTQSYIYMKGIWKNLSHAEEILLGSIRN